MYRIELTINSRNVNINGTYYNKYYNYYYNGNEFTASLKQLKSIPNFDLEQLAKQASIIIADEYTGDIFQNGFISIVFEDNNIRKLKTIITIDETGHLIKEYNCDIIK